MSVRTEIRQFKGKDVTVVFSGDEDGGEHLVRADVSLTIDGCKFGGVGHKSTYEEAYEIALSKLEDHLSRHANGAVIEFAKIELSLSQQYLTECEQKQKIAKWFIDFTKK